MSKIHEVQEHHRGKWIPIMITKEGKEIPKTVRITEEHAELLSQSAINEVKERKSTNHFRYVLKKAEKKEVKKSDEPTYVEMKVALKEAGVEFKSNANKAAITELYKSIQK